MMSLKSFYGLMRSGKKNSNIFADIYKEVSLAKRLNIKAGKEFQCFDAGIVVDKKLADNMTISSLAAGGFRGNQYLPRY
jgi:hypothetical protein